MGVERRRFMTRWIAIALILLLAACDPEPTPFPVDVPVTPTVTPLPTDVPQVRYALAPNTNGFVAELERIESSAQVIQLDEPTDSADLGVAYDLVVAYGALDNWTQSEITPHVTLIIDPDGETLSPDFVNILRRGVNPQAVIESLTIPGMTPDFVSNTAASELRAELANLGKPDGLELAMGYAYTPGVLHVEDQLAEINIKTRLLPMSNDDIRASFEARRIQLALVSWTTQEEQQAWHNLFGAENAIDLYTTPISYRAIPELVISFTSGGFPIARY
jgi:hypothetical protein